MLSISFLRIATLICDDLHGLIGAAHNVQSVLSAGCMWTGQCNNIYILTMRTLNRLSWLLKTLLLNRVFTEPYNCGAFNGII